MKKIENAKRIYMMSPLFYQKNREKGQGLVEYAFLIVLVGVVILVSIEFLSPTIKNIFTGIASPLNKNNGEQTPIPTQTINPIPTLTWETCAVENGFCSFSGPGLVRYGANETWMSGTFTDGVLCANSIFGDPLVGTAKTCQLLLGSAIPTNTSIPPATLTATVTPIPLPTSTSTPIPTWTTCAVENSFCSFSGAVLVRYGANNTWISGIYTDGVLCANSIFGDPLYGTVKSCQIYR